MSSAATSTLTRLSSSLSSFVREAKEDSNPLLDAQFAMVYHGNFSYGDTEEMTIDDFRYLVGKLSEQKKKEQAEAEKRARKMRRK